MLHIKANPVGVDIPIQKLQEYLQGKLLSLWGMQVADYEAFGRCYRNQKEDGYVAEVYTGDNEYREVYVDDRISALSFFGYSGSTEVDLQADASIHLIFFVNLEKIKPAIAHRGDEEARQDVLKLVKAGLYGFKLREVTLGVYNVLREYAGTTMAENQNLESLYGRDMHPFHCFRLDFELKYNINQC